MRKTVQRFVLAFQKAVRTEMEAMREQLGPFEVAVDAVHVIDVPADSPHRLNELTLPQSNEKLTLNGECTLVHDDGEVLVTITAIARDRLTVRSESGIPHDASSCRLVIYPWFLYERLLAALEGLPDSGDFCAATALRLFGKIAPLVRPMRDDIVVPELNASQQTAVQLCRDSDLAFVWGPPGTGKTTTLAHIVVELLHQGHRVLVTSTTNAAVDQALAKLATQGAARELLEAGQIVRVGQTDADTFGAALAEVVARQNEDLRAELTELRSRRGRALTGASRCAQTLNKLAQVVGGQQMDLFGDAPGKAVSSADLLGAFRSRLMQAVVDAPHRRQQQMVEHRQHRFEHLLRLCQERIEQRIDRLYGKERTVVRDARVVLATMTNMYISTLLSQELFDVVIVEEAGMAVLPTLFYCAGLGRKKVIAVGDPRQLPPIVLSRDRYVASVMGRSIFEVTVPEPHLSDVVAMLNTQYRMHPAIGALVSRLFYDGRLLNDVSTSDRERIASHGPYPGQALVVVDTDGRTCCTRQEGSFSRYNEQSAEACVALAREAIEDGIESVAIITPYAQQSSLIRKRLSLLALPEGRIECRTVHRFQGNERDLVILDTVDTRPMRPGVLLAGRDGSAAPHLMNVSLSRARGKLVIVADVAYFRTAAPGSTIDCVLAMAAQTGQRVSLPTN